MAKLSIRQFTTKRLCLSFGLTVAVAGVLGAQRTGPAPDPAGAGIIFVYYPSLCAAPGDSSNCHEITRPSRPSFDSMAACSAYADVELSREHNPRLMASCMKEREG